MGDSLRGLGAALLRTLIEARLFGVCSILMVIVDYGAHFLNEACKCLPKCGHWWLPIRNVEARIVHVALPHNACALFGGVSLGYIPIPSSLNS